MGERRIINGVMYEQQADGSARRVQTGSPGSGAGFIPFPRSPEQTAAERRANEAEGRANSAQARANEAAHRSELEWNANHNPDGSKKEVGSDVPGDMTKTGEEYLKTIPEPLAIQVRMMAEGRRGLPSGGFALTNPHIMQLIGATVQYDPTFDAVDYNARAKTRNDFTSGVSGRNIKALNTALGHLGQLGDQIGGTASHGFTPLNALENKAARTLGSSGITKFSQTSSALASELTQVFRGSGGAEADVKRYLDELNPNQSLEQKKATISNIAGLLNSRLQALNDQYDKGMGGHGAPLNVLDDHAKQVLQTYIPGFDAGGGSGGNGPSGPSGGAPPSPWDQPSGKAVSAATGQSKTTYDPATEAAMNAMLRAGAGFDQLNSFATSKGYDPLNAAQFPAVASFAAKHPNYRGSYFDVSKTTPTTGFNRAMASAPVAALAGATNMAGAGALQALVPGQMDLLGAAHPLATGIGDVAGAIGATKAIGGAGGALASKFAPNLLRGGGMAQFGRNLATDMTYGGAYGENTAGDPITGALTAGLGSSLGQGAGKLAGAAIGGIKVSPAVERLRSLGIPMTVGQTLGGLPKSLEDAATSIPFLGDIINARRLEGLKAFNGAAFDQAGAPIGATANGIGQRGIDDLIGQDGKVGQAYDHATAGANIPLDPTFGADMSQVAQTGNMLPPDLAAKFNKAGENMVGPIVNSGAMTGEGYQQAMRGLKGYRAEMTKPGFEGNYRDALGQAMDALTGNMMRGGGQGVVSGINNANEAYRASKTLQRAVGSAKNGTGSGEVQVFTPAQLNTADYSPKYGGRQFGDLADAGQSVLPSKIPDSGTGRRVMQMAIPAALGAAGGGAGYAAGDTETGAYGGLGLGALLAIGGTRGGQKAINAMLTKRTLQPGPLNLPPDLLLTIADQIRKRQGLFGAAAVPLGLNSGQ